MTQSKRINILVNVYVTITFGFALVTSCFLRVLLEWDMDYLDGPSDIVQRDRIVP